MDNASVAVVRAYEDGIAEGKRRTWLEAANATALQKEIAQRQINNELAAELEYLEKTFRAKAEEQ